jgi:hypothetical protein
VRAATVALALAGCGRLGFGELVDGAGTDTAVGSSGVRVTLRLDKIAPTQPLDGYVLPIVLDDAHVDRAILSADASDLELFDSAGNDLDLEIEQLGPPLIAWIKVPTISGLTTTIDMRYGTPRDVARRKPWDTTYDAVFHFAGGSGKESSNAMMATNMGAVAAPGVLGSGIALAGSQYMVVPTSTEIATNAFTVEGWINMTTLPVAYYALLAREVGATSDDDVYLGVQGSQALATCEHANNEYDALGGGVTAGNWVYVVGTADSTAVNVFIDGVPTGTVAVPGALQHSTSALFIGADANGGGNVAQNDFVVGTLDELRISNVIRPDAWIEYTFSAFRDQVITYP